jgi:acyl carrier protein
MTKDKIREQIRLILISVLKHERFDFRDDLNVSDVEGWDSLSHMIIISEIETAFGIKFKLKELNRLNNIGAFVEVVEAKL